MSMYCTGAGGSVCPFTVVVDVKDQGQPGAQIEVDIPFTSGQRWSIRVRSGGREVEKCVNNANQKHAVHIFFVLKKIQNLMQGLESCRC